MSDKMIVVNVVDGDNTATITWTEAYGFIASGSNALLDQMSYEERDPRRPNVGTPEPGTRMTEMTDLDIGSPVVLDPPEILAGCVSCGHREHVEDCDISVRSGPGPVLPCGCKFVTT